MRARDRKAIRTRPINQHWEVVSSPGYEGGDIVGPPGMEEHYHVSAYVGEGFDKYEDDYVAVMCSESKVAVLDHSPDATEGTEVWFHRLDDAVSFCMKEYERRFPGEKIVPVWGAGSPNGALERLGYRDPWLDFDPKGNPIKATEEAAS